MQCSVDPRRSPRETHYPYLKNNTVDNFGWLFRSFDEFSYATVNKQNVKQTLY